MAEGAQEILLGMALVPILGHQFDQAHDDSLSDRVTTIGLAVVPAADTGC